MPQKQIVYKTIRAGYKNPLLLFTFNLPLVLTHYTILYNAMFKKGKFMKSKYYNHTCYILLILLHSYTMYADQKELQEISLFIVDESENNECNRNRAPRPGEITEQIVPNSQGTTLISVNPKDFSVVGNLTVGGNLTVNGAIVGPLATRALRLLEDPSSGTDAITFQAPFSLPGDYTLTWPANAGLASQLLATDGFGNLSWTSAGAGSGDVLSTGNMVSATMLLGTLNGFDLNLISNGTARIVLASGGAITMTNNVTVSTGNVTLSSGNIALTNSTSSATGNITKGGTRFLHNFGTNNIFAGTSSGNFALSGSDNSALGSSTLASLTTGNRNTVIGSGAGLNFTTGTDNTLIGYNAGSALTVGNFGNIFIGSGQTGTAGDVTTIRIGNVTGGASTACYIDGIASATVGASSAVLINSSGKLGTLVSSRRYKDNIQDLESVTENFMLLRPVSFVYKNDATQTQQCGLIAEEVEPLFPELITHNQQGAAETVQYHLLYAHFIKMIQEQHVLLTACSTNIQQQNVLIEGLQNRILHLENTLQKMNIDIADQ